VFEDAESTVMSLLHGLAGEQVSLRQVSLERFCMTYTRPLVNYLVKARRLHEDDAADLVQDFWVSKMLRPSPEDNLVARYLVAQQAYEQASFRSYLSVSLNNFLRSRYRAAGNAMRRSQVSIEQLDGWEAKSPEDVNEFDLAWANHVLVRTLEGVRQECNSANLRIKWTIFARLILQPYATNQARPAYSVLAEELGLQNPKEIGTALTTFKRIFLRHLHIAVLDYLPANSRQESIVAAEGEVATILAKLSKCGGLELPLAEWGIVTPADVSGYSLNLNNLSVPSLIQSDGDYQALWNNLLTTSLLSDVLGVRLSGGGAITVASLVAGEIRAADVLDQIRSSAKRLGASSGDGDKSPLNRKLYGLIYLVAIAAAKLFRDEDISRQSAAQLTALAKSFSEECWIDQGTKQFLQRYAVRLVSSNR
jgi:DNA-directed RNA polymerase specialized sigma24 family protein